MPHEYENLVEASPRPKGIGGTEASPLIGNSQARAYTPEELHQMADDMEQDMLVSQIRGPSVSPSRQGEQAYRGSDFAKQDAAGREADRMMEEYASESRRPATVQSDSTGRPVHRSALEEYLSKLPTSVETQPMSWRDQKRGNKYLRPEDEEAYDRHRALKPWQRK
jgi:hypothetical protein